MARIVNPGAIKQALSPVLSRAGDEFAANLDGEFSDQIAREKWFWPNLTNRSINRRNPDDTIVDSPRDIIDTGNLDNSQTLSKLNAYTWEWVWAPKDPDTGEIYALYVHEGYTIETAEGSRSFPARPWTKDAVRELNPPPEQNFAQEVKKLV